MFDGVTIDTTMHDKGCDLGDGKSIAFRSPDGVEKRVTLIR